MRVKVVNYLSVGTTVWVVDPDRQQVEVYVPGQPDLAYRLAGDDAPPGFVVAAKEVFQMRCTCTA